jgi:hypothetical protein
MEEFLKDYVYYEVDSTMYEFGDVSEDGELNWNKIDMGESGIRANILGIYLSWLFEGRYKARRTLPRSKYRRLCKRVEGRFRKLMKRYKDV